MGAAFHIRIKQSFSGFALDIDMSNETGGVTALFGPSGAGKTAVVNAVAGLIQPERAFIRIGDRVLTDTANGVFVKPHLRRVGYVFQDARLFPNMTVRENLSYATRFHQAMTPSEPVIDMLGIDHLLDRHPRNLSGGEAQRVAIGRALMSDPEILLMDEPLAALDDARREEILPYLDNVHRFSGAQMLYVSHSMAEVARLADTIVLLKDGKVSRQGAAADILSDPEAVPEIGVRAAGASLQAVLSKKDAGDGLSELTTSVGKLFLPMVNAAEGDALRVRILASDIILSRDKPDGLSALNILPASVETLREGAGPGVAVALKSGEDRLVARITRRSARALKLTQGTKCFAIVKSVSVAPGNIGKPGVNADQKAQSVTARKFGAVGVKSVARSYLNVDKSAD